MGWWRNNSFGSITKTTPAMVRSKARRLANHEKRRVDELAEATALKISVPELKRRKWLAAQTAGQKAYTEHVEGLQLSYRRRW